MADQHTADGVSRTVCVATGTKRCKVHELPHQLRCTNHGVGLWGLFALQELFKLPALRVLDVSHNLLSSLPPGIAEAAGSLEELSLQGNTIQVAGQWVGCSVRVHSSRCEGWASLRQAEASEDQDHSILMECVEAIVIEIEQ
jgi:hypothetical protein